MPFNESGRRFVTPGIATAERLQGFRKGWTSPGATGNRGHGARWKLTGNAVTVGVAAWLGRRLVEPGRWDPSLSKPVERGTRWPLAGWGDSGRVWSVDVSMWPERRPYKHLADVMGDDCTPLSLRGSSGFLSRLERGNLHVPEQFRIDLKDHIEFLESGGYPE